MVETIAPVVYGARGRYLLGVTIYALAATLVSGAFGALLGMIGLVAGAPWGAVGTIAIIAIAGLYFTREALSLPIPIFDRKKQVPDWWRTFYAPTTAAALYGAGLGVGFLTFLGHGTLVVVAALAIAGGDPLAGAILFLPFGFVRGLSVLISARSRDEEGPALAVHRLSDIAARTKWTRLANAGVCLLLGAAVFTACSRPDYVTYEDRAPAATLSPTAVRYAPPSIIGRLSDPKIEEASGLVASRAFPDVLWLHNDSGDGPKIYCARLTGASCGTFTVRDADAVDWEDIALGPGPGDVDHLYIGDIGDNERERKSIAIYRIREPDPSAPGEVVAERFDLQYPDRAHDAETLMIHPDTGDLYIVTKETSEGARVFAARAPLGSAPQLHAVAILDVGSALDPVTGGAISPDGDRLILATYARGYELSAAAFGAIWAAEPRPIRLGRRSQGETVTYSADGTVIYATSEGRRAPIWAVEQRP